MIAVLQKNNKDYTIGLLQIVEGGFLLKSGRERSDIERLKILITPTVNLKIRQSLLWAFGNGSAYFGMEEALALFFEVKSALFTLGGFKKIRVLRVGSLIGLGFQGLGG